jgi:hypothetical protein
MGDKPVPAVPDRILDLKTPPFPSAYPDPIVPNKKLQKALDNAIADGPGSAWRTPVALVSMNPDGTRWIAHFTTTARRSAFTAPATDTSTGHSLRPGSSSRARTPACGSRATISASTRTSASSP